MYSRESILAVQDNKLQKVNVPEWGMDVFIRSFCGSERDAFEAEMVASGNGAKRLANMRARLAVRALCDETGKRLFEDSDAEALGQKSAAALDRIITAIQSLNALGDKEVKHLGEASTDTPSVNSGSV